MNKYDIESLKQEAINTLNHYFIKGKRSKSFPPCPISVGSIRSVAHKVLWLCKQLEKAQRIKK